MKRSLFAVLAAAAVISCTACGKDVVSRIDEPTVSTEAVTTTAAETTAVTTTAAVTTVTTAAEKPTEAVTTTEAQQEEAPAAVPAGGGESAAQQQAPQQSQQSQQSQQPAQSGPVHSHDAVPTPDNYNYGPAPAQYNIEGLTYIQGVLIANKSYSLPSNFNPGMDSTCLNQFYKLQNDASAQGLYIYDSSDFRSYDYQSQIYNNYVARDGQAAADTYSARPGYSEHQTGLAIDVNQIDDSFIGTPEANWLEAHCHEYGFILRYPRGKQDITGYKYESWHIRYVGTDMSYAIHSSGLTLEEYFGIDSYYH